MRVKRHEDVDGFREVVLPFLLADEVANCMLLGLVGDPSAVRRTVWEEDRLCAVLVQTPGRPAMISTGPTGAGDALGSDAAGRDDVNGVYAPTEIARAFCEAYTRGTGHGAELHFRGAVHRLERVIPPTGVSGELAVATGEDRAAVVPWVDAFARSIGEPTRDAEAHFALLVGQRRLHLWRDGGRPVSMAAWAGPTPHGVRINSVYTPPEFRNRGYASAVVAALSQRMLDSGKSICFLNTDLANPTSNSIYRKIGYTPCGERESYRFV